MEKMGSQPIKKAEPKSERFGESRKSKKGKCG
jgi:hypothetical protein